MHIFIETKREISYFSIRRTSCIKELNLIVFAHSHSQVALNIHVIYISEFSDLYVARMRVLVCVCMCMYLRAKENKNTRALISGRSFIVGPRMSNR